MQLMQYEITLPADYDMDAIRDRVSRRGHRTDDFPGLGVKAYLVREVGRDSSPVNQYAPFYLWAGLGGMNEFLFGPGLDGIRTDFGRPVVHTWHGVALGEGPARGSLPTVATRSVEPVDAGLPLPEVVGSVTLETSATASRPGVVCSVAGIDPTSWQLVRFTLWDGAPPEGTSGERYLVLHVSQPQRSRLDADLPRQGTSA